MRTLPLTTALALAGCAHLKESSTVCPEYRDLRCVTAPECSFDRGRECEVCHCTEKGFPTPKAF